MCCEQIERLLGRLIDGELTGSARDEVVAHLQTCPSCRTEHAELERITSELAKPVAAEIPELLWPAIERRLLGGHQESIPAAPIHGADRRFGTGRRFGAGQVRRRAIPWAIAASVVLVIGLGMFGLSSSDSSAQASTIDFGVLLNALPLDARKAFTRFLVRYDARPTTPIGAKRAAPELNFDTPQTIAGGFELQDVYELRIGKTVGIAVSYERDGEFLAAVFHAPMKHGSFGSHQNYACVVGKHCGHKVQIGEWKLVHLTDSSTCHCLLSRQDEKRFPEIMAAIAPDSPARRVNLPGEPHGHADP